MAVAAIVADLPAVILIVLTALAGASATVFGLMLLTGVVDTAGFDSTATTARLDAAWWWYAVYGVLAVAGMVAQVRIAGRLAASAADRWRHQTEPGADSRVV